MPALGVVSVQSWQTFPPCKMLTNVPSPPPNLGGSCIGCSYLFSIAGSGQTVFFFCFKVWFQLAKVVSSRVSRSLDSLHHHGTVQIENIGSLVTSAFYLVFYRTVFAHAKSYGSLVQSLSIHIGFELLRYALLLSWPVFSRWRCLQRRLPHFCTCVLRLMYGPSIKP